MSGFYGLPTGALQNDYLRLEYLAEAGPRIVRLCLGDSDENLLAELPDFGWPTPHGRYHVRGGHRLWHAPESSPRTYVPDDNGLTVRTFPGGVELRQPTEASTGLRKVLLIQLHRDRPAVTLTHQLCNDGAWPVEVAPWAITQLRLGGLVVLPQSGWPGAGDGLSPNRHLVLWPYARWDDPRLHLHDDYLLFQATARQPACKFGYLNTDGWAAYLRDTTLLVKRFQPLPEASHPDRNCNVEVYGHDQFVELETIAPLALLNPGAVTQHIEVWELFSDVALEPAYPGIRAIRRYLDQPRRLTAEPRA